MANELAIVDKKKLSPQERQDIDKQVEDLIERHKQNRYEINRLVFESTAALTAGDKYAQDMNTQGMLKRFRKRFTGGNARTQDVINADLVKAQYAAQQTLQKLADQNQLNVELIDLFNERLNASLTEVNVILSTRSSFDEAVIVMLPLSPFLISSVMDFAPASMEFSISSFTAEEGLSATSPAAIRLAVC